MTQKTVSIEIPAPPEGYGEPVYGDPPLGAFFARFVVNEWCVDPKAQFPPFIYAPKLSAEQLKIAELEREKTEHEREIEKLKQETRRLRGNYFIEHVFPKLHASKTRTSE